METHNTKFIEEFEELSLCATTSQPLEFEELSNNDISLLDQQETTLQTPTILPLQVSTILLSKHIESPVSFTEEATSNDVAETNDTNEEVYVQPLDIPIAENKATIEVPATENVRRS